MKNLFLNSEYKLNQSNCWGASEAHIHVDRQTVFQNPLFVLRESENVQIHPRHAINFTSSSQYFHATWLTK
jgi:hypothetical protein